MVWDSACYSFSIANAAKANSSGAVVAQTTRAGSLASCALPTPAVNSLFLTHYRITIETMISKGFKPTRTVVLAFGFDEEASGLQGAGELGAAMRSGYGEDLPFAFIVDEGGTVCALCPVENAY